MSYMGSWRVNGGVINTRENNSGFDYYQHSPTGPSWFVAKGVGLPSTDDRHYRLVLGERKPLV